MKSIRQRLFTNFIAISLLLILSIWLFNSLFLKQYYVRQVENTLVESFKKLNDIPDGKIMSYIDLLINIETQSNVDMIIYDPNDVIIYTSNNYLSNEALLPFLENRIGRPPGLGPNRDPKPPNFIRQNPIPFEDSATKVISDQIRIVKGYDPIIASESISLIGKMDNGYDVSLRLPIASIQTSIMIINRFLLFVGFAILLISIVASLLLSNYFTKPIRQINAATNRLKSLDFSEQCEIHTEDELGQLAHNVNSMSQELSQAINSLHLSNKQLTEEINQKNLIDDKRRQLLNNVSHELKTPLSLMEGYAEALKLGIVTSPEKTDFYCDVIMDETEKMNQLVQNLLSINQIEFGDHKAHPVKQNISNYIKYTLDKYAYQIKKAELKITYTIEPDIYVMIDPIELEQLFSNYLTNAIHYGESWIHVTLKQDYEKGLCRILLSNDSLKLDDKTLAKLWDSFYKVDASRSRSIGGHGLGLSIVKAIQSRHGLAYGVSNDDKQITFWFDCRLEV